MIRILIADDHELVRETIGCFLAREDGFVVSTAGDIAGVGQLVDREGPYDLILLDYSMPGMNGLDGLAEAQKINGGNPVAVISGTASPAVAEMVLARGGAGFLPKTMPARSLINAVRFMLAGETYVPFSFMAQRDAASPAAAALNLTSRELDVLRGLIDGRSNKEIAHELALQEVTVKLHVKTLCRKLDARNRTHAAMIGKDRGLTAVA